MSLSQKDQIESQKKVSPVHMISPDYDPFEYLQEYFKFSSSISPVLSAQFPLLTKREIQKLTIYAYKKLIDPE